MNNLIIVFLSIGAFWLMWKLLKEPECTHENQVYYDAAGDELPRDQSDACFCKCLQCGQVSMIPSGFQSDAHFEHYLYEGEQGGSRALRKIKRD